MVGQFERNEDQDEEYQSICLKLTTRPVVGLFLQVMLVMAL